MKRIYSSIVIEHFKSNQQMLFLSGPRQAGKTTVSLMAKDLTGQFSYLNWDNLDHRTIIVKGVAHVANYVGLNKISGRKPVVVFDEIHKYGKWKTFLKGFFDTYKRRVNIIVTGSSRLDLYKKGGDSLMGRYFLYRLHPLSVGELARVNLSNKEVNPPVLIKNTDFNRLFKNGGYPEPFLKNNTRFLNQWRTLRQRQLIEEDIRDLSRIQELGQIELLAEMLKHQSGKATNYSTLATKISVSVDTIRRWLGTLQAFYYCFTLQPWSKNVPRSLIKEPKTFLWDWVNVEDPGSRFENFVALHLLKAVHFWTDCGMGAYDLWFVRDKEKREVDFLVTKNQKPWFLVEAKSSENQSLNKSLYYFQKKLNAAHAFQVTLDMDYVNKDCFTYREPVLVPIKTFLSQLV